MPVPSQPLPTLDNPNSSEDPKVRNALAELQSILTGSADLTNLATATRQSFLQLAIVANRKLAFGSGSLIFNGSAVSNLLTVPHGLGVTPVTVIAMAAAPSDNITDAVVINTVNGLSPSQWQARGRTVSGASIGPGPCTFSWLAIG